jgi:hypothetical protein
MASMSEDTHNPLSHCLGDEDLEMMGGVTALDVEDEDL